MLASINKIKSFRESGDFDIVQISSIQDENIDLK
jgi:hypothetical protein